MFPDKASSMPVRVLFLVIFCSTFVLANDDLNFYGGHGPNVICVFPLSGPYNLLQRLLFYTLLIFVIIARRQKWLVLGALASTMSYSGAAAIHGMLMVSPARKSIDLDVYGVFAITSSGAMLAAPILTWSSTLMCADKRKRLIVILWGILLMFGALFTAACIHVNGAGFITPECLSRNETISFNGSLFPSPTGDCLYTCPPERRLFRPNNDVIAFPNHTNRPRDITSVFLPATLIYVFTWIVLEIILRTVFRNKPIDPQLAPAMSATEVVGMRRIGTFVQNRQNSGKPKDLNVSIQAISSPSAGESSAASTSASSWSPKNPQLPKPSSRWAPFCRNAPFYFAVAHFSAFIVNVVMSEFRIKDLPSNEQPKEIGQWIPWVSVALVVFSQTLNHYLKVRRGPEEKGRFSHQDEEKAMTYDHWKFGISPQSRIRQQQQRKRDDLKGVGEHLESMMFKNETTNTTRRNSF
ncbi:hypothetical protein PAAG_00624 [Paracoccidioides lutzii Pb01]|uniref:Integral membrane protein n=1 Tax=Paracoccidioides lutzii (strain ATCC MYA-826 / Pb01) TaxID=502779 RepID=C1GQ29_PARBA|nr:hypothetical protein PAAG_00624 [Paracoccidioides lutzii Pb01]EEH36301.2 hypothetical protein PAAG_00624 [Paracoccidioides lutzii Pb01]